MGHRGYCIRTASVIDKLHREMKIPDMLSRVLAGYHRMARRMYEAPEMGGQRPLVAVHSWRTEEDYRRVSEERRSRDSANRTGWRHNRPGHVALWEEALVRVFGLEWRVLLESEEGRRQWSVYDRPFIKQWKEVMGLAPGSSLESPLSSHSAKGGDSSDSALSSLSAMGAENGEVQAFRPKKAPEPRPWHLLHFRIPPPGSFQMFVDNQAVAGILAGFSTQKHHPWRR